MASLKLGLQLGYWGSGPPPNAPELVAEAERLGFDSVWTAEAYGSDALTPLAWWGLAHHPGAASVPPCASFGADPTAMAMAALTLDHLCGGRLVLGLGVSGPQVVEGWYGQPFPKPWRAPGSTSRSSARCSPAKRQSPTAVRTTPCRIREERDWAAPRRRSSTRCATTSPSFSVPKGPRTWRWRRRSPMAGSRSSSPPRTWA